MVTDPYALVAYALLLGVATRRLCRLIQVDSILDRPRAWFFDRFPPEDTWVPVGNDDELMLVRARWVGQLADCPWCLSVWIATAGAFAVPPPAPWRASILTVIAATWVAAVLARLEP